VTSRHLEGHFAPLREEYTLADLEVAARIPDHLNDRYLRKGPNPVDDPRRHQESFKDVTRWWCPAANPMA
jgi:carotenoid cleavage dioxygenase-like enzyme